MNLQQLAVFREVMETGSVSAAARNLGRTQPAVSASLKALEANLGIALFEREGRRLVPVPEAHYLLSEATEILARVNTTEMNLVGMRNRTRGSLSVVGMPGPSVYLLPDFVSRFGSKADDLKISLSTRSSPQILNLIAAQAFDVGFCDLGFCDMSAEDLNSSLYQTKTIMSDCLCALPAQHPLAGRAVIDARQLSGERMGVLAGNHSTNRDTRAAFEQAGAVFNPRVEAQYFIPLLRFVEAGQICTVLDPLSAETYKRMNGGEVGIWFARFLPSVRFGYSIVTPKQRPLSLLAQDFVDGWSDHVREIIADHS